MRLEGRPAVDLSRHPGAVKARRWRARRAAERRGAVLVALLVEPGELAGLRQLGLLPGASSGGPGNAPAAAVVEAALRRLMRAAGPLARLAGALASDGDQGDDRDAAGGA